MLLKRNVWWREFSSVCAGDALHQTSIGFVVSADSLHPDHQTPVVGFAIGTQTRILLAGSPFADLFRFVGEQAPPS